MKFILIAIAFLAMFSVSSAQLSLCDKYSVALNVSNVELVGAVVDGTVSAALGSSLKKFFDGTVPTGSTNFTAPANAARLGLLRTHLIQFFALPSVLNCTDGTIASYQGDVNMTRVHMRMPITTADFNLFNSALLGVMAGAGVETADLNAVSAVLNSTKPAICNQPDCFASATTGTPSTTTGSTTGSSSASTIVASFLFVAASLFLIL